MFRKVRRIFSGHRNRFVDEKFDFDLDLTYITEKVIAMGFPGEGVVSVYRNSSDEIAAFLHARHNTNFMIWNLSTFGYDYSKFDNQVMEFGFPDHHAPPFELLFTICKAIHSWLKADPDNVICVHCLAGKGRTGTVIACYLLYSNVFDNAETALDYFAAKRSHHSDLTLGGVSMPSQRRYVMYFDDVLSGRRVPTPKVLVLKKIYLHSLPLEMTHRGEFSFVLNIFSMTQTGPTNAERLLLWSSKKEQAIQTYSEADGFACINVNNVKLQGDILIKCQHLTRVSKENMFRFSFHTAFVPLGVLRLQKADLDEAFKDKKFSDDFMVDLFFEEYLGDDENDEKASAQQSSAASSSSSQQSSSSVAGSSLGTGVWNLMKEQYGRDMSKSSTYVEVSSNPAEGRASELGIASDSDFLAAFGESSL